MRDLEKSEGRNSHNSKINENMPNKKTGKIDMIKSREQKIQGKNLKELNYNGMEEKFDKIVRGIESESEQIQVPESLSSENMKKRLIQKKKKSMRYFAEIAAAVVLVAALGGAGVYQIISKNGTVAENADQAQTTSQAESDTKESLMGEVVHMQKIGKYRQAENYEEIYDLVSKYQKNLEYAVTADIGGMPDVSGNGDIDHSAASDTTKESLQNSKTDDFSKTNTMFEGIDESDFVKNDFDNLFVQDDNKVSIIDISGEKMKLITTIKPDLEKSDKIREMYADTKENRIVLIIQRVIEKEAKDDSTYAGGEVLEGCFNIYENADASVIMQTYDITDRENPQLVGTITMDGRYKDSRKSGQMILLFTTRALGAINPDDKDGMIPSVNGEKMNSDCIYIGEDISSELIMATVSLSEPDQTIDQMTIMSGYAEIYMSDNALYLYESTYKNEDEYTEITRFPFHSGYMCEGHSVTVRGNVNDKFAISEGADDGTVRVLTTIWNVDESTNELHLYDYSMKEVGSLTGIAKGEEVYAARYIGNIAYFITYHNTDPLFAADISDPQHPKMLGNVKMTGYSDYLHPYGDNLLLGIGYETDPDTSETLGVKLTMFDISDPVNLKILDSVVIDDANTQATNSYKAILADARKNLIGFGVDVWDEQSESLSSDYLVYRWKDNHFVNMLTQNLGDDDMGLMSGNTRGVYAGMRFYCISQEEKSCKVISYDMEKSFEKLDVLKL